MQCRLSPRWASTKYGWKNDELATPDPVAHVPAVSLHYIGNSGGHGSSPQLASQMALAINDSCGVRTHALADWRLKPAP